MYEPAAAIVSDSDAGSCKNEAEGCLGYVRIRMLVLGYRGDHRLPGRTDTRALESGYLR